MNREFAQGGGRMRVDFFFLLKGLEWIDFTSEWDFNTVGNICFCELIPLSVHWVYSEKDG